MMLKKVLIKNFQEDIRRNTGNPQAFLFRDAGFLSNAEKNAIDIAARKQSLRSYVAKGSANAKK